MTQFQFKQRNVALDEAKDVEIYDGEDWMATITIKHFDAFSMTHRAAGRRYVEALSEKDQRRYNNPRTPEDYLLEKQVDVRFIVSEYVTDSKLAGTGKYTHDVETLVSFFTAPGHGIYWAEVSGFGANGANFKRKLDEEVKNG